MARPGRVALFVLVAVAALGPGPVPAAPLAAPAPAHPAVRHPPQSGQTLAELAAAHNLTRASRPRLATARRADDDAVLGAQKYPFGLANPQSPERFAQPKAQPKARPLRPAAASASAKAVRDDDVVEDTFLPTNVVPVRYTITMAPQIEKGIFYGSTDIYLNVVEATSHIVLHGAELNIQMVEIFRYSAEFKKYYGHGEASLRAHSYSGSEQERLQVELSRPLVPGEHYLLRFPLFDGRLRDDLKGFYLSSYKNKDGKRRELATTQFESTAARYAFPCFDEPTLKARFKIVIEHAREYSARSNMPAVKQTLPALGTLRTEFDETVPMSTYLLAWVVSDFAVSGDGGGDFLTWGRANALSDASARLSQWVGPRALEKLKDFTGIAYALPKMDQFAIPDFEAGAMENWGLVTYREEYLLETERTSIRIKEFIATTVCHELGHQWTGNLVTLDWWSNTWLNEAFATYFENVICDQILPEWKLMDKYVTDNVHVGIENDVLPGQVAMSSPVHGSAAIAAKFDRISYKKGGAVLRMFEHILGTAVWKKALNRYLSINAFKNGSPDRLFKAMAAEAKAAGTPLPAGVPLADVARTWTEQAGVPVVTAVRDYARAALTLTQRPFRYAQPDDEDAGRRWYIPVPAEVGPVSSQWGWRLSEASETTRWLTPAKDSLTRDVEASASEWLLLNPNQIGYYLVNYDEDNWRMLQAALVANRGSFPASTRTQLVHDALALARAGELRYAAALPFLQTLKGEQEAAPWRAGIEALAFLNSRLASTPASCALQEFVKSVTSDTYGELGFAVDATDDVAADEQRYVRFYVASYACNAGNVRCVTAAIRGLQEHLAGSASLHADVKATAMCFGVRNSAELFGQVLQKWKEWSEKDDEEELAAYAAALSCTQDHRVLAELLDSVLNKKINKSAADLQQLVNQLISRWDNHKFLIGYYKKNHDKIAEFTRNNFGFNLLLSLIGDIRTEEEYRDLEALVAELFPSASSQERQEADLRLEAAEKELDWYRRHYDTVSQWLYDQTGVGPISPTEPPAPGSSNKPTDSTGSTPTQGPTDTTPKSGSGRVASAVTLLLGAVLVRLTLSLNSSHN